MYALSKQTRPHEDGDEDYHPQAHERHPPAMGTKETTGSYGTSAKPSYSTPAACGAFTPSAAAAHDSDPKSTDAPLKRHGKHHRSSGHAKHHRSSGRAKHHTPSRHSKHHHRSSELHSERNEDDGKVNRLQDPVRCPAITSTAETTRQLTTKSSSGEVAAASMPARAREPSQMNQDMEDQVKDSYVEEKEHIVSLICQSSGELELPAPYPNAAVGAFAVGGMPPPTGANSPQFPYEDSFVDHSLPHTHHREPMLEATCVPNEEADIEAQVEDIANKVERRLMENVVKAEVHPDPDPDTIPSSNIQEDGEQVHQRRRLFFLVVFGVLVIAAAVGAGVGVAASKKNTDDQSEVEKEFQSVLESVLGEKLMDENAPQFKALKWIANEDSANITVGVTPDETIKTRYIAAVLYYALGGEEWNNQYNFLSEGDVCTWNQNSLSGIVCSSDKSVEQLILCKFGK